MPRKPIPELIDDENPEWTEADFARMRPAADVLREHLVPVRSDCSNRSAGAP